MTNLLSTSLVRFSAPASNQPPKSHLALPFELILLIAENLSLPDLNSFLQVSRCFSQLLTPLFNQFALQPRYRTIAVYWAIITKNHDLATLLLGKGKNFIVKKNDTQRTIILKAPEESPPPGILDALWDQKDQIIIQGTFDFCTPLHDAARHGRNHIFRLLLEAGANVDIEDIRGWTPLHHATWESNKFAVKLLIGNGSSVDTQDDHGMTPLHLAAVQGSNAIAGLLLAAGANVSLGDVRGWTPIEMREFISTDFMLPTLLRGLDVEYKSSLNQTALHLAVLLGDLEMSIRFLDKGVDINAQDLTGGTALHDAAAIGDSIILELLLARGAEVDIQDSHGLTPFHCSIFNWPESIYISTILFNSGADIKTQDYSRNTIFDNLDPYFKTKSEVCLLEKLLHKTDISFRTKDGRSPLHIAVESGTEACVLAMLNKGFDINGRDEVGWTALHYAAGGAAGELKIRLLIDKGADTAVKTKDGMTAVDIAFGTGSLTATLLEAVDNIDFRGIYLKQNLVHLAVQIMDLRLTKIFIDKGVGINAQDTSGRTPLHYATFGLDWEMVTLLMGRGADNTIEDNNGLTPLRELLQLIKEGSCPEEYAMVLVEGLDLESKDINGNTLLDLAIKHKHKEVVSLFQVMMMSKSLELDSTRCNRFKRRNSSSVYGCRGESV